MYPVLTAAEILRIGKREEEALPGLTGKISNAERLHARAAENLERLASQKEVGAAAESLAVLAQTEATLRTAAKLLDETSRELTAVRSSLSEEIQWLSPDVPLTPFGKPFEPLEDSELETQSDRRRAQLSLSAKTAEELLKTAQVLSESILASQSQCRTLRRTISASKCHADTTELLEALAKTRAAVKAPFPGKKGNDG